MNNNMKRAIAAIAITLTLVIITAAAALIFIQNSVCISTIVRCCGIKHGKRVGVRWAVFGMLHTRQCLTA